MNQFEEVPPGPAGRGFQGSLLGVLGQPARVSERCLLAQVRPRVKYHVCVVERSAVRRNTKARN